MSGYRAKTIKSIISRKMEAWFKTIEDPTVQEMVRKGTIVTGGAIVSMLLGEDVNDFDVYMCDYATTKAIAEYYVSKFEPREHKGIKVPLYVEAENGRIKIVAKSAGVVSEDGTDKPYQYFESRPDGEGGEYVEAIMNNPEQIMEEHEKTKAAALETDGGNKFRPVFLTSNAITLSDKVQVVIRFYGDPEEIHKNYDFVHCTSYWSSWDNKLVLRPEAMEAILAKELKYVGSRYPLCSLVRLRKFIQRGWKVNAGQILKMAMQVSELDLTNIDVLEDQLTGVDTAYFLQLITALKANDPEKVNTAYLVEIVDRLF
jgi:hypothetical protein